MARVLEYIHEINTIAFTVRVWAKTDKFDEAIRARQITEILRSMREPGILQTGEGIVAVIAKLDFCSAVEVKGTRGQGVLIYPDWP